MTWSASRNKTGSPCVSATQGDFSVVLYILLSITEHFALRRDTLLPTAAKGCNNAAKDPWSLDSRCSPVTTPQKGPQGIASAPIPAAAPTHRAAVRRLIGGVLACRSTKYASQQRVFFIFRGPTGRTCTCRRWRHVRDLIIAKIGRTTRPHFALQER